jgi:S-adenosyl-L-methionine hydrolase (adenosine-forming)
MKTRSRHPRQVGPGLSTGGSSKNAAAPPPLHRRGATIILTAMTRNGPPIVFVSDFGLSSEWVGTCHSVMSRIAPQSRIVDLSHFVRPLNVTAGAQLLVDSLPYLPDDAVIVAIVDPNVGKDRNVAVEAAQGRMLVGPDNGLLSLAWEALGGVGKAVEITSAEVTLQPVSPSFHARDILCPAAAHLAAGMAMAELGGSLATETLSRLEVAQPEVARGKIRCAVVDYNRFGNVQLNVRSSHVADAGLDDVPDLAVEAVSGATRARRAETYADLTPGEYGVIFDPRGWLSIVRGNPANALEGLGLDVGDSVWISA